MSINQLNLFVYIKDIFYQLLLTIYNYFSYLSTPAKNRMRVEWPYLSGSHFARVRLYAARHDFLNGSQNTLNSLDT